MEKFKVAFQVKDDYQKKIQKMFSTGIAESNNQENAQLPVPATFIINSEQEIVARQFDVNYKKRASVKWMLENLPE
jgi:peroxiredoxin